AKTAEEVMVPMITLAVSTVLQSLEPKLFTLALKKMQRFITENVFHNAGEATASICRCFVEIRPEETLEAFMEPIVLSIQDEIIENGAGKSGRITTTEVLPRDRALLWNLRIFFALIGPRTGNTILKYLRGPDSLVRNVINLIARECKGTMYYYVGKSLINVISSLTGIYVLGGPLVKKESIPLHIAELIIEADLSDWAPITDPEKLDIKWHVPDEEETQCAIELYRTAVEFQLNIIDELLVLDPTSTEQKKPSVDWTDELRQALKYIVNALVASIPLYQRCPRPEEWEVIQEGTPTTAGASPDLIDIDSPDIEEDAAEDDEDDDDAGTGRSQKYVDGFINRPLNPEQTELLKSLYKRTGVTLLDASKYLWAKRKDDMQAFIEVSTV
ncbi:MAG TPA: hypothetical protein VKI62_08520, partial [Bacteroidota bacterium]|nr:hypothetical protein [Bacteroidota bacterium]